MSDRQSTSDDDSRRLLVLINGYRATCLIGTAVKMGLFEALRDGSVPTAALATDLQTDPDSLRRFLQALRMLGLLRLQDEKFGLTDMGRLMLKGDCAFGARAVLALEEYLPAWANLHHSVRTGRPAFDDVFGVNAWQHRLDHPELGDSFHRVMVDDQRQTCNAVVDVFDFIDYRTVVDVGGGLGQLLTEILTRHSSICGTLFDQEEVVEAARIRFAEAQILERCALVGGSFFDAVPAGGDLYILQHILHDWSDDQCLQILRNCRSAMSESSRLLVIENVIENAEPNEHVTMLDLHMMAVLGGRERTAAEYVGLLASAGLAAESFRETVKHSLILTVRANLT